MRRFQKLITAGLASCLTAAFLCVTAFADPVYGSRAEAVEALKAMVDGIYWYFIISTIIGAVALVIGIILAVRANSARKKAMIPPAQYPY